MADQPRCEPLEASEFFDDGKCARDLIPNTVSREGIDSGVIARAPLDVAQLFEEGMVGDRGELSPLPVTAELLAEGQERYDIFCSPCHGFAGYGNGMIVQRGFPPPSSLHEQRLRDVPDSHLYNVITNGIGVMYPYASRVPPAERWAIVAYIRALQLSQNAAVEDIPIEERAALGDSTP
ncbi:MAG: cytochrome c [Chloroflexota bacterium]|nr:cytochrome c [Chloroflexota bacterium]